MRELEDQNFLCLGVDTSLGNGHDSIRVRGSAPGGGISEGGVRLDDDKVTLLYELGNATKRRQRCCDHFGWIRARDVDDVRVVAAREYMTIPKGSCRC